MAYVLYGVWNGLPCDNRSAQKQASPDAFPPEALNEFNAGNSVLSFVGPSGFAVFSPKANLAAALYRYYKRAAEESCGRCSPCRSGAPLLLAALEKAAKGQGASVDWEEIEKIAAQMVETSMCGIGKTTPKALLGAIKFFPEALKDAPVADLDDENCYEVVTSPCIEACPSHVDIPRYIDCITDGTAPMADAVLLKHYPLVGSCGRVCVRFCEKACRRNDVDAAVDIKQLKRYAADSIPVSAAELFKGKGAVDPKKPAVAVIGAGPAGVNCAYHLLLQGYPVTIFEQSPWSGGMARVGIPSYRLPKEIVEDEGDIVVSLGGKYEYGKSLGKDFSIDDLFAQGFKAVFVGVGASKGSYLGTKDENTELEGYENGIDFLQAVHDGVQAGTPPKMTGDVIVVGGGNVAMDCCRSAVRLTDGKVIVVYRRTEADAPADAEEIEAAKEEGVIFSFMTLQDQIIEKDGKVAALRCIKMADGGKDARGRTNVVPVPDSEWNILCSHVIAAIGQYIPPLFTEKDGVACDRKGRVTTDEFLQTSRPGVFAGGDCATGPATLIEAMAQGEQAAFSIKSYLETGAPAFNPRTRMNEMIKAGKLLSGDKPSGCLEKKPRAVLHSISPEQRDHSFTEVEFCMPKNEAIEEADRCMRCYRIFSVVTENKIPGKED